MGIPAIPLAGIYENDMLPWVLSRMVLLRFHKFLLSCIDLYALNTYENTPTIRNRYGHFDVKEQYSYLVLFLDKTCTYVKDEVLKKNQLDQKERNIFVDVSNPKKI